MKYIVLLGLLLPLISSAAQDPIDGKILAALQHERRSEADRARDKNRKPLETLKFFRLQDDQTVLELIPGGGWYTRILGPVLSEKGKLYESIGTDTVAHMIASDPGFSSTEVIPFKGITRSKTEEGRRTVPEFSFGVRNVDLVLTFRNMHNFDATGRMNLNRAVFDTLKTGGLYGIVDHTRRHMQPDSYEVRRRLDPVMVIREVEAAGFKFVDFTDLHYRPDDELRYDVGRKTVIGNSDRFTLLFEKP